MAPTHQSVLDPDDLNDADEVILDELSQGRVTPKFLAGRRGLDRSYANQRLTRLVEHDHVDRVAPGLYELADDPRGDMALQNGQTRAELEACQEELSNCRTQLEVTRAEVDAVRNQVGAALDDAEAAAERGDGDALRAALERARGVVDDG